MDSKGRESGSGQDLRELETEGDLNGGHGQRAMVSASRRSGSNQSLRELRVEGEPKGDLEATKTFGRWKWKEI